MNTLKGNLSGIRATHIKEMEALYDFPVARDEFLPADFARALADCSARFNREIAVYINRIGQVMDIAVGEVDQVPLAEVRDRRSQQGLARVRLIHTHPGGDARLSDVDLAALKSLSLDAICAIGVTPDGQVTGVSAAFLGPQGEGDTHSWLTPVYPLDRLPQQEWMDAIQNADRALGTLAAVTDRPERAFLISVDSQRSLAELSQLAHTAGAEIVGTLLQNKARPDPATYIGSGKAGELALEAQAKEADLIIVDDEMQGSQAERLSALVGLPVVDRTTLILDIFARRAQTAEGKLQVALAQLNYRSRHLVGMGAALSRLAGGIGTRGPGESKLEIDRRRIRERVVLLRSELDRLAGQRAIQRKSRQKNAVPVIALVGYTNAGKSSLLNALSGADLFAEDLLFATLDAVSRRITLPSGQEAILVDSVGFINKLPTDLIEAFHATLEEAVQADILVIVSDGASPEMTHQRQVVEEVLDKIGANQQPRIEVVNKTDLVCDPLAFPLGAILVSAKTGEGLDQLLLRIEDDINKQDKHVEVLVPFDQYALVSDLRQMGRIISEDHEDAGTRVSAFVPHSAWGRLRAKYPGVLGA